MTNEALKSFPDIPNLFQEESGLKYSCSRPDFVLSDPENSNNFTFKHYNTF